MIKYEYELSKFRVRPVNECSKSISEFGKRGFRAIYTVKDNQDIIVLFEKEIEVKAKAAKPKSE